MDAALLLGYEVAPGLKLGCKFGFGSQSKGIVSQNSWTPVQKRRVSLVVRAEAEAEAEVENKGRTREGPAAGGKWLSSTTRHVHLYAAYIDPVTLKMDQTRVDKLSLILDPDNEFVWPEDKCQKVYDYLKELVDNYAGAPLTEYTLRLIGSDLEHYIRKMLLAGEIKYNLNCRVLNFSMGKPRIDMDNAEEAV